ncbi:hypothetical protein GQ41_1998 [Arenibacter algicola]|uniref:Uncharacterized protein n=1 Tax=Arenibacter algicola TaxID=616991 RepID=A0ABY3AFA3_9FLAO
MANTLDPMGLKQIITLHLYGLSNRMMGTTLEAPFPSLVPIENRRCDELIRCFEEVNNARNHPGFILLNNHHQ